MLKKLGNSIYGEVDNLPVNLRIFSGVAAIGIIVTTLQLVVNIIHGQLIPVAIFACGIVLSSVIYYQARFRRRYYFLPLILMILIILSVDWFYKDGVNGGVFIATIIAFSGIMLILPNTYHKFFIPFYCSFLLLLLGLQYQLPEWFTPYPSIKARFLDLTVSILSLLTLLSLGFRVFTMSYVENKHLIESQSAKLIQANRKLQATEEELRQNMEELSATNESLYQEQRKLKEALNSLKKTQTQLIQSEKMASLGVLTAGIAHEINNPVNFIAAGNQTLGLITEDLLCLLKDYHALAHSSDLDQKGVLLENINIKLEEVGGMQELESDARELYRDITIGTDRVTDIVQGLKSFSHGNNTSTKPVDMHQLIEANLVILKSKYQDKIKVIKDWASALPPIPCLAGEINQALLNVLSNAIEATPEGGQIHISTQDHKTAISIIISDTGVGMNDQVKQQLFTPFFTTKPVGSGTGLGMSITYNIIEKHGGSIHVDSTLGEGSTFTITLPKDSPLP